MIHIIYRISDLGYVKEKPSYINHKNCFDNANKVFKDVSWYVIADNVNEDIKSFLIASDKNVEYVNVGHGAGTFNVALDFALGLDDDDIVYFLEDDYLHKMNSDVIIDDGLNELFFDYVSLYDHPDKYLNPYEGGNPFCAGKSEQSRVYLGLKCHWKLTNSTTMTFASKIKTLKQDEDIIRHWTKDTHPHDFQMFQDLIQKKGRRLASTIPGYATHGETKYLSPLTQWEKEL